MFEIIITFFISIILAPIFIKLCKKLKFGQNILGYVTEHSFKQGTPTMGGVIFILPTILISLFFCNGNYSISIMCLLIFLGYGFIGFLDDYIKIKFKRNLGLRPYQKIIFQLLISIIVSIYIYKNNIIGNFIYLPFSTLKIDLGFYIIPFVIFIFLATTNSVNLTDGLDGLAGSITLIFLSFVCIINVILIKNPIFEYGQVYIQQMYNLNSLSFCLIGGILAFLVFNIYPAKIFMGDTGSLALGSFIATICCFNGLSLYIAIIGFMFVLSSLSVIIQVLVFKKTRKRVFLMAPFHHHLEHKGLHENKIVFIYILITIILGLICLLFL